MTTIAVPFVTVNGNHTKLNVPSDVIDSFLSYVLNTNHWKWTPELIHDRALRVRKAMVEKGVVDVDAPELPADPIAPTVVRRPKAA